MTKPDRTVSDRDDTPSDLLLLVPAQSRARARCERLKVTEIGSPNTPVLNPLLSQGIFVGVGAEGGNAGSRWRIASLRSVRPQPRESGLDWTKSATMIRANSSMYDVTLRDTRKASRAVKLWLPMMLSRN